MKAVLLVILFALSNLIFPNSGNEERVEIESEGWKIIGTLNIPESKEPVPIIILCHTLWGGNRSHYDHFAKVLAKHGIASLRIDMRGHGESINRGKLEPRDLDPEYVFGAWQDVIAAQKFVKTIPGIDSNKIGMVGASYTGEAVARAGREYEFANAYVILASGVFSPESIVMMEKSNKPWMHVVSKDDTRSWANDMVSLVQKRKYAEVKIYETGGHATALLVSHPELNDELAIWFKKKL